MKIIIPFCLLIFLVFNATEVFAQKKSKKQKSEKELKMDTLIKKYQE